MAVAGWWCACCAPGLSIDAFTASPDSLPADGGLVRLSWAVRGATALRIDQGVGAITPVTAGELSVAVSASIAFTLTATAGGATDVASAQVVLRCDDSPGTLSMSCLVASAGQCVDFSNLSALDATGLQSYCRSYGGMPQPDECPEAGRFGTCNVPPGGPKTGVTCSPHALILEHYSPPATPDESQAQCAAVRGAVFSQP